MAAIYVPDVPEETLAVLRERAVAHGRSVQAEIREILQAAAAGPVPSQALGPIQLVTADTDREGAWTREEIYGDLGR